MKYMVKHVIEPTLEELLQRTATDENGIEDTEIEYSLFQHNLQLRGAVQ